MLTAPIEGTKEEIEVVQRNVCIDLGGKCIFVLLQESTDVGMLVAVARKLLRTN